MTKYSWGHKIFGSGSSPAATAGSGLDQSKLSELDIVAREPFQNSKDEKIKVEGKKLIFKLKIHLLTGEKKKKLIKMLDLKEIKRISSSFVDELNYFDDGHKELKNLDDDNKPISILEVFDNAGGLGGRWFGDADENQESSNFFNLVLTLSNTDKPLEGTDSLGSYGQGKMVFAKYSKIRTMLYYSHFKETAATEGEWARCLATGFFPKHNSNGKSYSGHSYFGLETDKDGHEKSPIINEDAQKFIKELSLPTREKEEFGTSVFIIGSYLKEISELREAFEKWWWPVLEDPNFEDQYEIIFENHDGKVEPLQHKKSPMLAPYLKAYANLNLATSSTETSQTEKLSVLRAPREGGSEKKVDAGKVCWMLDNSGYDNPLKNCTAIIRDGMIVNYADYTFRDEDPRCVGVFQQSKERAFKLSEPVAHDDMNPYDDRLLRNEGTGGRDFIKRAIQQLKDKSNTFQISKKERSPPQKQDPLAFIDNKLMAFLRSSKGTPDKIINTERATVIRKEGTRVFQGDRVLDQLEFKIKLKEQYDFDDIDFDLNIQLQVAEGSDGKKLGSKLAITVKEIEGSIEGPEEGKYKVRLKKGVYIKGVAHTPVNPEWVTRWLIDVDPTDETLR